MKAEGRRMKAEGKRGKKNSSFFVLLSAFCLFWVLACELSTQVPEAWRNRSLTPVEVLVQRSPTLQAGMRTQVLPTMLPQWTPAASAVVPQRTPVASGTPGPPTPTRPPTRTPGYRDKVEEYTVQTGENLNIIAARYDVEVQQIVRANRMANADQLNVGQVLQIPPSALRSPGPKEQVMPDAELVYGPPSVRFDVAGFVRQQGGYLASYQEEVEQRTFSGAQIVERVGRDYSVNPRLLLAVLEYQSGWVTQKNPARELQIYPIINDYAWRSGLYRQLAFAANQLNRGFYLWQVKGLKRYLLADGVLIPAAATLNAGTAGVQNLMSWLYTQRDWETAVSAKGLLGTYQRLFGNPNVLKAESFLPAKLAQPVLQLPFEAGVIWSFTSGPHAGWADGSAWAALDFAPSREQKGCVASDAWVVAMADGVIVRSDLGAVVQDLDGDGFEQTGWTLLYMHIETRERVPAGKVLRAGDRIGHPSCEGGVSSGTHVHIARRYNGVWISADTPPSFVLDGWITEGDGAEYDGFLKRNGKVVEAWYDSRPENQISR